MRPLTKTIIKAKKFKISQNPREENKEKFLKQPDKKVAQCCAKSSSIISGCHD